jgi:glutathione S-transferase
MANREAGMVRIWGRTSSINVQKVTWTVAELGLPHERIDAGGPFGGLDGPEYAGLNPNRLIPVLQDRATVVWESNAIVRYLAGRYGSGGLWPEDAVARSETDRWMDWQLTTLQPAITPIFWGLIRTPPEQRDLGLIAASAERLGQAMTILDRHLADRPFVAGDSLTMGDIPVGCACWRYANLDVPRPDLPNIAAYRTRLESRAGYRAQVMLPLV